MSAYIHVHAQVIREYSFIMGKVVFVVGFMETLLIFFLNFLLLFTLAVWIKNHLCVYFCYSVCVHVRLIIQTQIEKFSELWT